jgi:hypothetical protein
MSSSPPPKRQKTGATEKSGTKGKAGTIANTRSTDYARPRPDRYEHWDGLEHDPDQLTLPGIIDDCRRFPFNGGPMRATTRVSVKVVIFKTTILRALAWRDAKVRRTQDIFYYTYVLTTLG